MSDLINNELKAFDIYYKNKSFKGNAITDLLNEETCKMFLEKLMKEIKAPNPQVAASMLSKRYAYLTVASTLYSMVIFNGALSMPVKACSIGEDRKLYIQEGLSEWLDAEGKKRSDWCEMVLSDLFINHITPLVNSLNKTSRVSSSILWENIAIRINSIYRKTLAIKLDSNKVYRLKSDYNFLKNASGDVFNLKENPIKSYLKIEESLKLNPYRKTCCMYYKLGENDKGNFCNICPVKS